MRAHAQETAFSAHASAGLLGLSRFDGDDAGPLALSYGAAGTLHLSRLFGAGVALNFSQPSSYRVPCSKGRFCLRRFQHFGPFGEARWRHPTAPISAEPWLRIGVSAIQSAKPPLEPEGEPTNDWALGVSGRLGVDARFRRLLLGVYGEAVFSTGAIGAARGLGLQAGWRFGEPSTEE